MAKEKFTVVEISETGEVLERDMTPEEVAQKLLDRKTIEDIAAQIAADEARRQSRREKLLALGLTEEELDA